MNKKFLANVLAASLVLTMTPVVPNVDADAAQKLNVSSQQGGGTSNLSGLKGEAADVETLTGIEWWAPENDLGAEHALKGDDVLALDVEFVSTSKDDGYGAFSFEIKAGDTYITTNSDDNGFTNPAGLGTWKGNGNTGSKIVVGHKYRVFVKREGSNFSFVYYDVTDAKVYCSMELIGIDLQEDLVVYIKPQVGTYKVSKSNVTEMPEIPDDSDKPPVDDTPTDDTTPGTNFSNITTQPVESYTFDNDDKGNLILAGESVVSGGAIEFKKTDDAFSFGKTYAQLPDLTKYDFSNGITLTADVKVDDYSMDWTSIFMLGDGTLTGNGDDAIGLYHFSQGFSSVGGSRATTSDASDWFVGYFGNAISAPYAWNYFADSNNRKSWYTLTVTITNDRMTTYVNGVPVQAGYTDYKKVIDSFKVAKNNYLGASYWATAEENPNPDFVGKLDNIGIYDTALSDADVRALTSAKGADVAPLKTPAPLASYPLYTPTPTAAPALPSVAPEPTPVLEPETLTGTAWWTGSQTGRNYTLKGEGTLDLYVKFDSTSDAAGYGAFNVELLSDGNKYITTGSDINAWTAEAGEGTISGAVNTGSVIVPGHVYKISVTRKGYDFTIVYYDLTDNKEYCTLQVTGTNQGVEVNVHIIAQVGTYTVSQTAPDAVAPEATATPDASASPAPTTDPNGTPAPGDNNDNTPGGNNTPGGSTGGDTPQTPGTEEPKDDDEKETKKTMKVSNIKAKKNTKKVTGTVSVKGAKVKVKVGKKAYKNAKVSGKKFTFTASSKLKKGTKITIKITKSGYKTITKTVKVK